jgi:DNA-binding response OmpR family regulator
MRILLVDDHLDSLTAIAKILTHNGHDVATAHNLLIASSLCKHGRFDFVISDPDLPDGDGCDLARLASECGTKAIALTAHGFPEHRARTKAAGFCAHLLKPVGIDQIELTMQSLPCIEPDATAG